MARYKVIHKPIKNGQDWAIMRSRDGAWTSVNRSRSRENAEKRVQALNSKPKTKWERHQELYGN